jgi:hypothetical protein
MTVSVQMQFPFKDEYEFAETARTLERVENGREMKIELERYYGDEGNFCVTKKGDNCATEFPDGNCWADCTSWAIYVRRIEKQRAKLYGFDSDENPESEIAQCCGGHDFAVVDDRFLVDGWVVNVEGLSERAVFDMHDAADMPEVHRLYGDLATWLDEYRQVRIEQLVDAEGSAERMRAMKGVIPRASGARG